MQVCAYCASIAAQAEKFRLENVRLRLVISRQQQELEETEAAFWDLAGDVRLSPIRVDVSDQAVAVELVAVDQAGKEVA